MRAKILKKSLFFLTLLVLPAMLHAAPPTSFPTVPATCDGEFYKVMSNRAWMEGSRELEAAQTLILKADSVLEYSCFKQQLGNMSTVFASVSAVNGLIETPMQSYLNSNFSHDKAGGKFSGAGSTCSTMYKVWEFLKCSNFDIADFKTFTELAATDPRALPEQCNVSGRDTNWNDAITAANPPPASPPALGGVEAVNTYLNLASPTNCSAITPIPTGLQVARIGASLYEEKVCPSLSCNYKPDFTSGPGECVPTL